MKWKITHAHTYMVYLRMMEIEFRTCNFLHDKITQHKIEYINYGFNQVQSYCVSSC